MSKYGRVAVDAAVQAVKGMNPVTAWEWAAARHFPGKIASQKKGCPKSAFLGLAEAGELVGIPAGSYTRSIDNKRYARDALQLLKTDALLAADPEALWRRVMNGTIKQHNHQMEVVASLWQARKFSCQK